MAKTNPLTPKEFQSLLLEFGMRQSESATLHQLGLLGQFYIDQVKNREFPREARRLCALRLERLVTELLVAVDSDYGPIARFANHDCVIKLREAGRESEDFRYDPPSVVRFIKLLVRSNLIDMAISDLEEE